MVTLGGKTRKGLPMPESVQPLAEAAVFLESSVEALQLCIAAYRHSYAARAGDLTSKEREQHARIRQALAMLPTDVEVVARDGANARPARAAADRPGGRRRGRPAGRAVGPSARHAPGVDPGPVTVTAPFDGA